jgi:SAM-dependent methyltransferase
MDDDFASIDKLYTNNLAEYGPDSRAVGWNSRESQMLRFNKLNKILPKNSEPISINDYGCGYGAHLSHLLENGWSVSKYNGYDVSSEMLNMLRASHSAVNTEVINVINSSKVSTYADYSLVSGTFNVLSETSIENWENFIKSTLLDLKKFSKKGFSFNLLSTYVDWQKDGLYYADPKEWFHFCKTQISSKVTLIHDYDLFEWTILCRLESD